MSQTRYPKGAVRAVSMEDARHLLKTLDPLGVEYGDGYLFRGQADASWSLIPSALRPPKGSPPEAWSYDVIRERWSNEAEAARRIALFKEALDLQGVTVTSAGPKDDRDGEMIYSAIAQHYGVPTNLIDWTTSPYVAAYFAAQDSLCDKLTAPFAVWIVRSEEHSAYIFGQYENNFGDERQRWSYWTPLSGERRWDYDGEEVVHQVEGGIHWTFNTIRAVDNPNMRAQRGVLMKPVVHLKSARAEAFIEAIKGAGLEGDQFYGDLPSIRIPRSIDFAIDWMLERFPNHVLEQPTFTKLVVPSSEARETLILLDKFGINGATMFPGIAGATQYAVERALMGD